MPRSPSGLSSGPFTTNAPDAVTATTSVVMVSNLPFGSFAVYPRSSKAHPVHVSAFSGPGIVPGIRPVMWDGRWRSDPAVPISCRLSAAGVGLLDRPVPARELGLPCGRLTSRCWTLTGFPRFTRARYGRGGCPLYSGTVVSRRLTRALQPPPTASQRPVLYPSAAFHLRGYL